VASERCLVRPATRDDTGALRLFHPDGESAEITARLHCPVPGTMHYLVELTGRPVATFSLTELGRVRPGAARRILMHDMKIRARFRGSGVTEDIFDWLSTSLGAGRELELIALTPPEYQPSAMAHFGLVESHHAFKWAISPEEVRLCR
jgi:hypothetical protein